MKTKTLSTVKKGSRVRITSLPSGLLKIQLIRIGISEGDKVYCLERLPGGTIVLQKNRQEIAIGSELAKQIIISLN